MPNGTMSNLERLQAWYQAQCNEDWEHQFGVKISTLDNPGWKLEIDLEGTELEKAQFDELKVNYDSESDWIICQVKDRKFVGASGPLLLDKMVAAFLEWSDSIQKIQARDAVNCASAKSVKRQE
ncbi:rhodanese-related sulfurtransferase [Pseudoalteromonas rubra]|uniref:Rhodanese-related sulfurtransferase n=2 Tax=Pseudoalteromonas rubra TaxID=43658 RepID=A0A5S3V477_9GAMM|nr:rhodanese-related sulfurtransferase [Pseudoalteromonas rubra]